MTASLKSRTLLSILAVHINDAVWMVSTRSPTYKSPSPFSNPLVNVPKESITIGIIVIGAFGTVTKGLLKELEDLEVGGQVETNQTTTLLRTARILRIVLET